MSKRHRTAPDVGRNYDKSHVAIVNATLTRAAIATLCIILASGCSKPSFIKRLPGTAPAEDPVTIDLQVTPRELLTARLVNPPIDDNSPRITVGKLIEFADRYLSCDCSGTRFVKSWERRAGRYRLTTNSELVRPLDFACRTQEDLTTCYLSEIDRGTHILELEKRFVPGSQFIHFMYENGLKCERDEPCAPGDPPT